MVERAKSKWGRIDILINNAGILRDRTFSKMEMDDYRKVVDVHLTGTVICTKAVWETMREQNYGRILFTSSTSGLYGNFGQAAYGVAKTGMLGLMNVLHLEGAKYNIRLNMLAPSAVTRMTEEILPKESLALMKPELITPGVLYLVSENGPSRVILGGAAGSFARIVVNETDAVHFREEELSPEAAEAHFARICDTGTLQTMQNAFDQNRNLVGKAAAAHGLPVPF
jgi:NAD(P)-dependent dehydrogenase (short-subunit alcohol dehydrogenase family)